MKGDPITHRLRSVYDYFLISIDIRKPVAIASPCFFRRVSEVANGATSSRRRWPRASRLVFKSSFCAKCVCFCVCGRNSILARFSGHALTVVVGVAGTTASRYSRSNPPEQQRSTAAALNASTEDNSTYLQYLIAQVHVSLKVAFASGKLAACPIQAFRAAPNSSPSFSQCVRSRSKIRGSVRVCSQPDHPLLRGIGRDYIALQQPISGAFGGSRGRRLRISEWSKR
jgi:hypothetical protein